MALSKTQHTYSTYTRFMGIYVYKCISTLWKERRFVRRLTLMKKFAPSIVRHYSNCFHNKPTRRTSHQQGRITACSLYWLYRPHNLLLEHKRFRNDSNRVNNSLHEITRSSSICHNDPNHSADCRKDMGFLHNLPPDGHCLKTELKYYDCLQSLLGPGFLSLHLTI